MEKQWTMSGMLCEDNRGLIPLGGDISAEETRETLSVNDLMSHIIFASDPFWTDLPLGYRICH